MDNYLKLFSMSDDCDSKIIEELKGIATEELKNIDNQIRKEFKEKTFFFAGMTKVDELISFQIVSQYLRLISLIGFEIMERE